MANGREENERPAVHPDKKSLNRFVNQVSNPTELELIKSHLETCEFCREYCENYKLLLSVDLEMSTTDTTPKALELVDRLYQDSIRGRVIKLEPLVVEPSTDQVLLAADAKDDSARGTHSLTTQISHDPEIVLRLMQGTGAKQDYLQLIADDPRQISNVLIQIPELSKEYLTDSEGRAVIETDQSADWAALKWQIKMPDAVFELEPLQYDPNKIIEQKEITLTTKSGDAIKVSLQSRAEGKSIDITVLSIDGNPEFEPVKVSLAQGESSTLIDSSSGQPISFLISNEKDTINIRLFT